MKLYGYWRSSAAYRVRIALNLKGIEYEHHSVHLVKDGGQQHSPDYQALNPAKLVPTLVDGELTLNQSMAILDYLDQKYPATPLLPTELNDRALVLALANDIACDIHPLNNLRVLQFLSKELNVTDEKKTEWYHHWINSGFDALEKRAKEYGSTGKFLYQDQLTLADLVLIPQIYNAKRFNIDMSRYPLLESIWNHCNSLDAFDKALPENQPDAVVN